MSSALRPFLGRLVSLRAKGSNDSRPSMLYETCWGYNCHGIAAIGSFLVTSGCDTSHAEDGRVDNVDERATSNRELALGCIVGEALDVAMEHSGIRLQNI